MSGTPEDGRAQVGLSPEPVHPSVSRPEDSLSRSPHHPGTGVLGPSGCGSMGWAHGKGSGRAVGACFPRLRTSGPAHTVRLPLGSVFPLGPTDWLWKLLSTLQGKLFVQTAGPGLGWRQGGESSYLPVPFPPPPLGLSQREGTPVGDRVGRHRVGTNSEAAVGGGRGRGRSTSWGLMLSLSGTRFSSSRHTRPRGPGHHTETLHSLPGRSQQPRLPPAP